MKLDNIHLLTADLVCATGIHIGAGDAEIHIGGVDNLIVRNPITSAPYLPGSSIKGKMRSLLEWKSGAVRQDPLSWSDYNKEEQPDKKAAIELILKIFGVSGSAKLTDAQAEKIGPGRAAFWDCELDPEWTAKVEDRALELTEVKSENSISRISGEASNPRFTERVPAGARFKFKLSIKKLDSDGDEILATILQGMRLIELDGLGGSLSRGYGKVSFQNVRIDGSRCEAWDSVKAF